MASLVKTNSDLAEAHSDAQSSKIDHDRSKPNVGEWYWVKEEGKDSWLGCVTHVGTNYIQIDGVNDSYDRIHAKDIHSQCTLEPNPEEHINKRVAHYKREVHRLTDAVKELTTSLGLGSVSLPDAGVSALAVVNGNNAIAEYKTALVKAQETTLPELFKEIKHANKCMAMWLSATMIPLKTQAKGLEGLIDSVRTRIFNVELYAGLVETVEQIADGIAAPLGEKVRLMQRRAYMDEECLAQYECGGMDFNGIEDFDRWISRQTNRDRILPFQRCVIAFQVRRDKKYREVVDFSDFISINIKEQQDKKTFLYLRNGERLYRLSTELDFGSKLFPDMDCGVLDNQTMYAKVCCDSVDEVITEAAYLGMVEDESERERQNKLAVKGKPKKDHWKYTSYFSRDSKNYKKFTPDTVYYDDIEQYLQNQIDAHNRLVVVLQGLMDRSEAFHPHPKFSLWKGDDFQAAFELVYDDSRALVVGDRPNFEAFRESLNSSLKTGCTTVGQEGAWEIREAELENARLDSDWRCAKQHYRHKNFRPYGDPGPGLLAKVDKYSPRAQKCTYKWTRERRRHSWYEKGEINCKLVVPVSAILNVNAYKPGMFKQFYDDPRTRADYLQWAPLLLAAEEYQAGNLTGRPKQR